MSWSDRFLGIPFADLGRTRVGCDCWGLACVIYAEALQITLPDYLGGYASADEHAEIAALIAGETASSLWLPVPVSNPATAFDIAVFRRGRFATHVGVVIRPGLMIHMAGEDQSKVEGYAEGPWHSRFAGHFRHASRAVEGPFQSVSEAPR